MRLSRALVSISRDCALIGRDAVLQHLPWLLKPTAADTEALKAFPRELGPSNAKALLKLSALSWQEPQLRVIGRRAKWQTLPGATQRDLVSDGLVRFKLFVLASNTFSHIVDPLIGTALRHGILLDVVFCEYEEPLSWLEREASKLAEYSPDGVLIALDASTIQLKSTIGQSVDELASIAGSIKRLETIAEKVTSMTKGAVIVQTLPVDPTASQLQMDAWLAGTPRRLLRKFNEELAAAARAHSWLLLDCAAIADAVGHHVWSPGRYWYISKYPFAIDCVPIYTERVSRLLAAMMGKSKRVLVLDLDNTLWSGVVGDDGLEGIVLGPGQPKGEMHRAVQRMALSYRERGIVLCVSSKNTDSIAREAFRSHPDMLLREEDIALFRINWEDKASNLRAMAGILELGLESFVFLDDNPAERKQVRDALPLVAVPELPSDVSLWLPVFELAGYFEQVSFSAEDKVRGQYYRANALRTEKLASTTDQTTFLELLDMVLTIAPFDGVGRARIAQLIAKSNQFNTTTRRYSEADVARLEQDPSKLCLQVRLRDVFGDNGMISVVVCTKDRATWEIDLWLMSCRVLGRRVEEALLAFIVQAARQKGAARLIGKYIPTAKNALVQDLYPRLSFVRVEDGVNGDTTWALELESYSAPDLPMRIDTLATAIG